MIPEAVIAALCQNWCHPHCHFGGFSAEAKDRLIDAKPRLSSRLMAAGTRMRLYPQAAS